MTPVRTWTVDIIVSMPDTTLRSSTRIRACHPHTAAFEALRSATNHTQRQHIQSCSVTIWRADLTRTPQL